MYNSTSCINFLNLSLLLSKVSGLFRLIPLGVEIVVAIVDSDGWLKSRSAVKSFSIGEAGCLGRGSVKYSEDFNRLSSDSDSYSEWGVSSTGRFGSGFSSNLVGSRVLGFSS